MYIYKVMSNIWKYFFGSSKSNSIMSQPSSEFDLFWEEHSRSLSLFDDRVMGEVDYVLELLSEKHNRKKYDTRKTV